MLNPNASITLRQAENSVAERYDALVLGAGVVGVNTAYFLAKAGKSVRHRPTTTGRARDQFRQRRSGVGQPRRAVGKS